MPTIHLETYINASPEIVFDLSRSVDLHKSSMTHHQEEAIEGTLKGVMNKGDTVTWSARHLFKTRFLKVKITEINAPDYFCDEMIKGDFKKMKHQHFFEARSGGRVMTDRFYFESPFGLLGKLVNALFLKGYMTGLLKDRNRELKRIAESGEAQLFLNAAKQL